MRLFFFTRVNTFRMRLWSPNYSTKSRSQATDARSSSKPTDGERPKDQRDESQPESDTSREGARFGSSRGGQTPPLVPAPVTVPGTMCVSEQKQKKLSAPLVGRRGGMGACGVTPPASRHARASACSWTPRAAPTFQFHR
jgi:hypothetical protein